MSALRRYEILLPLVFNDGMGMPEALLTDTFVAWRARFAALSWQTPDVRGRWEREGTVYIEAPEVPGRRLFFSASKEELKRRFEQLKIWIA